MDVLIWKKIRELKKAPLQRVTFVVVIVSLLLVYEYLAGIQHETLVWVYPISVSSIAAFTMFSADDLAHAALYEVIGLRIKRVWACNCAMVSVISFICANAIMAVFGVISQWEFDWLLIVNGLLSLPVIVALIAFSTIHYNGNRHFEVAVASVFSIVNISMVFVPFVMAIFNIPAVVFAIVAALSLIGIVISAMTFKKPHVEDMVINTEIIARIYDEKFLGDDR